MKITSIERTSDQGASLTRRGFVLGSGAITVGLGFASAAGLAGCVTTPAGNANFSPIAWVTIGSDNVATIYSAGSEMGQGTMTALPMVLAEDMELDWTKVKVVQGPGRPQALWQPALWWRHGHRRFAHGAGLLRPAATGGPAGQAGDAGCCRHGLEGAHGRTAG